MRRCHPLLLRLAEEDRLAASDLQGYANLYDAFARSYWSILDSLSAVGFDREWLVGICDRECKAIPEPPLHLVHKAREIPEALQVQEELSRTFPLDATTVQPKIEKDPDGEIMACLDSYITFKSVRQGSIADKQLVGRTVTMAALYDAYMNLRVPDKEAKRGKFHLDLRNIPPEAVDGGAVILKVAAGIFAELYGVRSPRQKTARIAGAIRAAELKP